MSTPTTTAFNVDALDQWTEPREFVVERDRLVAYAQATNDDIPQHASGDLASPVFNVVPPFEGLFPLIGTLVPNEVLMRVVHGMQDFRFHRPITPGMTLSVRGAGIGIQAKSSGTTLVVKSETRDAADGGLVCEQLMTSFFRGVIAEAGGGVGPDDHRFPEDVRGTEPVAVVEQRFDEDQTFRYSPASGDPMPIHLDDDFAKSVGLPGIIIHGLCTMAFTSVAAIRTGSPEDPTRLKRLAVRFNRPALPGQTITTTLHRSAPDTLVFETVNDAGDVVIKDGLAQFAPAD
ncbi:dehydratase [Conexibacter sp. W3-3-2]|uniref:MaoC/PaaZ C-terminal domain-containing protein n=1 Tax=Conexibacter sp. W3-3-2 TaxID=2675227 RepID=UPI0012BA0D59|nr:MaoC/PaaZ C-terminal domain-containing protein [Conexibacter sp. W3-3-2]MTD44610.1 dehydratase [Conexibacter sp. W3-3-2]